MMPLTWIHKQRATVVSNRDRAEAFFVAAQGEAESIRQNPDYSPSAKETRLKELADRAAEAIRPLVIEAQAIAEAVAGQSRYWADPGMNFRTTFLPTWKSQDIPAAFINVLADTSRLPEASLVLELESALEVQDYMRAYAIGLRSPDCRAMLPQTVEVRDLIAVVNGAAASLESFWSMTLGLPNTRQVTFGGAQGIERGFAVRAGQEAAARLLGNGPSDTLGNGLASIAARNSNA